MAKLKHLSRKFLNKKDGLAAIQCNVDSYLGDIVPFEASVTISDCFRRVTLDFGAYEKKQFQPSLDKLNMLIDELSKMRDHIIDHEDEINAAFDRVEKNRNKSLKNITVLSDELQSTTTKG